MPRHHHAFCGAAALLAALLVAGCAMEDSPVRGDPHARNHSLQETKMDTSPPLVFDPSRAFHLEFGRGSGWHGLDTVVLDQTGHTVLHRMGQKKQGTGVQFYWETASIKLEAVAVQRITARILDDRLLTMPRAYHAAVHDGTQWVFWLKQGGREKSVYFNNHFPGAIQRFAVALDDELKRAGVDRVNWRRVPDRDVRKHEKPIWASIRY